MDEKSINKVYSVIFVIVSYIAVFFLLPAAFVTINTTYWQVVLNFHFFALFTLLLVNVMDMMADSSLNLATHTKKTSSIIKLVLSYGLFFWGEPYILMLITKQSFLSIVGMFHMMFLLMFFAMVVIAFIIVIAFTLISIFKK